MPFVNASQQTKILLGVLGLAAVWVLSQAALVPAAVLGTVMGNLRLVGGLGLILVFGWWAVSEAEEDDDAADVIEKTGERAESASKGLLDSTTATVMSVAMIAMTAGQALVDLGVMLADQFLQAPLAITNLAVLGAGWAAATGMLAARPFIVVGVALVIVGVIVSRRE